jgi:hypothetical protein
MQSRLPGRHLEKSSQPDTVHLTSGVSLRLGARLPSNPLFDVFKVETERGPGVLKLARHEPREQTALARFNHWNHETSALPPSRVTNDYTNDLPSQIAAMLLRDEAARIERSGHAWNHEVWAMEEVVRSARWSAAMLMPEHPGVPLSALTPARQRHLFPRMLPALWDALAAAPHHDLHTSNLLIAPNQERFVLLDPGGQVYDHKDRRHEWDTALLTLSNPQNYPVFSPQHPLLVMPHATLEQHYEAARRISGKRPRRETHARYERGVHVADLHALGVMYARILTGRAPYPPRAPSQHFEGYQGLTLQGLEASPPRHQVCGAHLPRALQPGEKRLLLGLLELEFLTREDLVEAASDALTPVTRPTRRGPALKTPPRLAIEVRGRDLRTYLETYVLGEALERGPDLDVFRVETERGPGVLKLARSVPTGAEEFLVFEHLCVTQPYNDKKLLGITQTREHLVGLVPRQLYEECTQIEFSQGAWNHDVWSSGQVVSPGPWSSALLLPEHPGERLSALPRQRQRELFPQILPALLEALTHAPHHDLSADCIWMDPDMRRFSLREPGGQFLTRQPVGESQLRYMRVTRPNQKNYPFFSSLWPTEVAPHENLEAHYRRARAASRRRPDKEPYRYERRRFLHVADLHALGVMYYRLLTGHGPYRHIPAPEWGEREPENLCECLDALTSPAQIAQGAGVTVGEAALARRLLKLEIRSEEMLLAALRDLERPESGRTL